MLKVSIKKMVWLAFKMLMRILVHPRSQQLNLKVQRISLFQDRSIMKLMILSKLTKVNLLTRILMTSKLMKKFLRRSIKLLSQSKKIKKKLKQRAHKTKRTQLRYQLFDQRKHHHLRLYLKVPNRAPKIKLYLPHQLRSNRKNCQQTQRRINTISSKSFFLF